MSIFSKQQMFSEHQAVTTTALSTNILDMKAAGIPYGAAAKLEADMGKGEDIDVLIQATVAAAADGSATVTFTLETSDNEDMSSSTVLYSSGAVGKASIVAGYKLPINTIPRGATKRFMAVRYTIGTGPLTAGKFYAGITCGNDEGWNK